MRVLRDASAAAEQDERPMTGYMDEVVQRIASDFPDLFDKEGWHDCPVGWEATVRELCARLVAEHPSVHCKQCKSKLGALRFYVNDDASDEAVTLIHDYQRRCGETCEECGEPGKIVRVDLWLTALCPKHTPENVAD